jgi:catechol 2,3-dioxygenase-like lactoylglutathione lyase family enzyme
VPVVLEVPVGVGREPVVAIAVEDDLVVVGDAAGAEELAEGLRAEEVPLDLVLQVLLPVEADRARDVGVGVQGRILVDLHDPDGVVVEAVLQPLGVDENVLRVVRHRASS